MKVIFCRALLLDPLSTNQTFLSNVTQPNPGISQTNSNQNTQEPNIDLELDIKVFINSGKCVLHTKDSVKEEEVKM